ncbi:MAG: PD-(D/E)XK motif protein [Azospirillaceae bacterium]|nr:PD-(D/E)XK motif protein [Azospirillaceae bacterium]
MAALIERLHSAWRALGGGTHGDGWRTIPVDVAAPCQVLVGRRFPGDEEAVLVGFRLPSSRSFGALPEGRGFRVERPEGQFLGGTHEWFSLSRQVTGSLEMFATMAADVLGLLEASGHVGDDRLFPLFVGRIRAWQEFMEKGRDGVLSAESEVGLFGELTILNRLLDVGVPAAAALDCWQGPMDAIQDFEIGPGAIEVKATIAAVGFPATIGSLEQLDDAVRQPLFVAGVRLTLDETGLNLPGLVAAVREKVREQIDSTALLDSRLLRVGFFDAFSERYVRKFLHVRTRLLPIDAGFPRLIRGAVPPAVTKARYVVDLDLVNSVDADLVTVLKQLGVL